MNILLALRLRTARLAVLCGIGQAHPVVVGEQRLKSLMVPMLKSVLLAP